MKPGYWFVSLSLVIIGFNGYAQPDQKIMDPIHQLFEGMKLGDSAMVHAAFLGSSKLFNISIDKSNQPVFRSSEFSAFLKAIGTPHKAIWNEIIWSPKVEQDGNFAQVWAPYAFYADKNFSHCGVDAFHLFRNAEGQWKIFHLTDTRRTEKCEIPKEVEEKMK